MCSTGFQLRFVLSQRKGRTTRRVVSWKDNAVIVIWINVTLDSVQCRTHANTVTKILVYKIGEVTFNSFEERPPFLGLV